MKQPRPAHQLRRHARERVARHRGRGALRRLADSDAASAPDDWSRACKSARRALGRPLGRRTFGARGRPRLGRRLDAEQYRRTSHHVWEAMAPGWERWRAQLANALTPVREWLIQELAPRSGATLLEIGAGTGETGFEAAARVGDGRLISTDFSRDMVGVARRRGTELGLTNVDYRVIDVESIELHTGTVDGVLCQSTYMLVADPAAALAETRRVLRPGGRLALSVSIGARILVERGHIPPPEPEAPGVFRLASEGRTEALLDRAGFGSVRTEQVPLRFAFRDLADYERWFDRRDRPPRRGAAPATRGRATCSGLASRRRSCRSPPMEG